jgi:geranylgeranyl pyrophosphate synthase
LELNEIYAPIIGDLAKVETVLKEISNVDFPWLSQLLSHAMGAGGKRIRPALTLLSGKCFNYRFEYLLHMALSIELMHTATLIHDDAIDKSNTRRGRTTIYKLWGTDPAILFGDYLFAKAGVSVSYTDCIRTIRLFSETLMIISSGELLQASNSFNLNQNREMYLKRIFGKTASLFCLSTESGGILGEAPEGSITALKEFGKDLGMAFQIVDDLLDFIGTEEELGKPAGSDLSQGTLTLPAMMLNERYPRDNPIKRLFQNHTDTQNIKDAIDQVRNSSIVDDCFKIARSYCDSACQRIKVLSEGDGKHSLVSLADFVVTRRI